MAGFSLRLEALKRLKKDKKIELSYMNSSSSTILRYVDPPLLLSDCCYCLRYLI